MFSVPSSRSRRFQLQLAYTVFSTYATWRGLGCSKLLQVPHIVSEPSGRSASVRTRRPTIRFESSHESTNTWQIIRSGVSRNSTSSKILRTRDNGVSKHAKTCATHSTTKRVSQIYSGFGPLIQHRFARQVKHHGFQPQTDNPRSPYGAIRQYLRLSWLQ